MWGTYYTHHTSQPSTVDIETRQAKVTDDLAAITFLAQWHPLIAPERADLRPEYNGGPVASKGMF